MIGVLLDWYRRYLSDPQAVLLALFLLLISGIIFFFGRMLAPVLAAIVIAYLLEGIVQGLVNLKFPRFPTVLVVFIIFMASVLFLLGGVLPLLSRQVTDFFGQLPQLLNDAQQLLLRLPERYPDFISATQVQELFTYVREGLAELGQAVLSRSLASIFTLFAGLIYLILVPMLVFFFLKDKIIILNWLKQTFLPRDRSLLAQVWREMDQQIGNYVRGKFNELLIVAVATYITFALMGLNYAPLLAALNGLSVLIPFVGAMLVTVPVFFAAYAQWGWGHDTAWLMVAYTIIQGIDANVVIPLLFSEAVNLHTVSIIVAILFFGGLWGFWGVFFAIPLATLVKALLQVWPRSEKSAPEGGIYLDY